MAAFYNQRGTAEQWIKEGKNAVTWTRWSCQRFAANAWRGESRHALAYNLANFAATFPSMLPEAVKQWSLSTLRDVYVWTERPNPGRGSHRIRRFWAIAALQQRDRRAVTGKILSKGLARGLSSAAKGRNRRLSGNPVRSGRRIPSGKSGGSAACTGDGCDGLAVGIHKVDEADFTQGVLITPTQ